LDTPGHWVFTYLDIPICGTLTGSVVVGIQGAEDSKFCPCLLFVFGIVMFWFESVGWY
jgi:hypothetical protein